MSSYQRLPTDPDHASQASPDRPETSDEQDATEAEAEARLNAHRPLRASVQEEFARGSPAWWKRALILLAIVAAGWFSIRLGRGSKPDVIYAQRYSDEHRFRPAGSPVITETLKDGRIRIRGASVGGAGVRETDIPKTPAQVAYELNKKKEEAAQVARDKMLERRQKVREKKKARKAGTGAGAGGRDP